MLETNSPTKSTQRFHLQFNAIDPSQRTEEEVFTPSCQIGSKTGKTGPEALPLVEFDWSWKAGSEKRCDSSNANKKFCDSTQLTIELVDKLKEIDDWFAANGSVLVCPAGVTCPEKSTSNLDAYFSLPTVNISTEEKDKIKSLLAFKALLIQDGYSKDFITDFDEYARNELFANAPSYYINNADGIGLYFKDTQRLSYDYIRNSTNAPIPGPGEYRVNIVIDYENDSPWRLFKGTSQQSGSGDKRISVITVQLEKLASPEEAVGKGSAFYYLPIDGLLGKSNSRIGYGANFDGTVIKVNETSTAAGVSTENIAGSVPVVDATASIFEDFRSLNTVTSLQGNTLKIERTGSEIRLVYSPSYATPIQLEVNHGIAREDAFAFYTVEVDGSAQNTGPFLAKWNGIGANCKDFNDRVLSQAYDNTNDLHGLNDNLVCARLGGDQITAYGLEWCNPVNTGKVLLETVLYTPSGSTAIIKKFASSDPNGMLFKTIEGGRVVTGAQFSLNKGEKVSSIEKIFELVEDSKMCITSSEGSTSFWWNPAPLLDGENNELLAEKENFINDQCIQVK